MSVKTYGYTPVGTELGGTPTETKAFTYGDTANPDRLTSYNGADITYNANGGVATYNGYTYSWSKGRLSTIYKSLSSSTRIIGLPTLQSSITYSFGYNGLGQRISSNYNYVNAGDLPVQIGELTSYSKNFSYDNSGRLIHETNSRTYYQEDGDSYEIVYLYDESGVVGMVYTENDTSSEYYFQRNLMGDIVAIYDTVGAKVAAYTYDAWGNCKIASSTTNYTIANANPFRYRGYYFDADTNLYYLNARYYSPEFRRFISPDDTSYLNPKNVNGCNLYCYCGNDPVNFVDPSGTFSTEIDPSKPLALQLPQVFLFGLKALWGVCELFFEAIIFDVGLGVGVGIDVEFMPFISLGAVVRDDLITLEKDAGPLDATNIRFGQKSEQYAGVTSFFGFVGVGKEQFRYFLTPEYNYYDKDFDSTLDMTISAGIKAYWGIGVSASIGLDLDYLYYGFISGQWYK